MYKYKLAMYDSVNDNDWFMINKSFIIENTQLLSGSFLRDLWFCYKLEQNHTDVHFMILEIKNNPIDYNNNIGWINRNHGENTDIQPSELDKPPEYYSNFSRYFKLDYELIEKIKKNMENAKNNSEKIQLYDDNCKFTIELIKIEDEYCLTLPRFELF